MKLTQTFAQTLSDIILFGRTTQNGKYYFMGIKKVSKKFCK